MKIFGIINYGNYKSYEEKFNNLATLGYMYIGSTSLNTVHNFKKEKNALDYKFLINNTTENYKVIKSINNISIVEDSLNSCDTEENQRKNINLIKNSFLKDVFFNVLILLLVLFNFFEQSRSLVSILFLAANILIVLYSVYIYICNLNAFGNNRKTIKYRHYIYDNISIFILLISVMYVLFSKLKNQHLIIFLSMLILLPISIIISYNVLNFVKNKLGESNSKLANEFAVSLISVIFSILVFFVIAYIIIVIMVHFKLI